MLIWYSRITVEWSQTIYHPDHSRQPFRSIIFPITSSPGSQKASSLKATQTSSSRITYLFSKFIILKKFPVVLTRVSMTSLIKWVRKEERKRKGMRKKSEAKGGGDSGGKIMFLYMHPTL